MYRFVFLFALLGIPNLTLYAQTKEALPTVINSSFVETRPLISPSGARLYFSRREHPDNMAGNKDEQDVWVADFSLDSLNPQVQNLGKLVNTRKLDALVSVGPNNQELILYNNKKFKDAPLLRLRLKDGVWSKPEEIVVDDFYNLSPYSDFYYSFKNNAILMALKRADSRGGQDLYVSFMVTENSWTEPLSLGGIVNTRKDDFAPFLAADGKSLFYCSYGLKGEGKADIYYSYRLDDTWTNWSAPINIGKGINSKNEEIYVSVSPDFKYVYFDSYSPEEKNRNVFRSTLPEQFWPKEEEAPLDSLALAEAKPIASIEEKVSVKPVEDAIEAAIEEPATTTKVLPEKTVSSSKEPILKPAVRLPEILVVDDREKVGRNIYFDYNNAIVKSNLKNQLQAIVTMLNSRPDIKIEIEGHADDRGSRESNIEISYRRAQTVKKYLVKAGIDPKRIKISWRGDTEPLASNDDEAEGRELNRRVEVFILK